MVKEESHYHPTIMVVGNVFEDAERSVSPQEAFDFASSRGLLYAESCAKTGEGVEEAFSTLIHASVKDKTSLEAAQDPAHLVRSPSGFRS